MRYRQVPRECNIDLSRPLPPNYYKKWLLTKKTVRLSGFLKICDFFLKIRFAETAEFSVSDTGAPLILTCLNNVTKFHKILIKSIQLRERTSFQMVNCHKQRAITTESLGQYGPLSNLKKALWY